MGAPDKVLFCPSLQQRVRPKEPQLPFPLLWQREGETGILRGTEVFSRGCQTFMPNHRHLKYSSAFQIAHFKSTTCSLLLCQLTLPLLFISFQALSLTSLLSAISSNDSYDSNERELAFLFVL